MQSNCHPLPGFANLSTPPHESALDDSMECPTRDDSEQDYRDPAKVLQPPFEVQHQYQHTRSSTSSPGPNQHYRRADALHKSTSEAVALRTRGETQLSANNGNEEDTSRGGQFYVDEEDIRSSTSSRALSIEFMENYREYLGPADCTVGRNSREISIPHFISHNSKKADYILGLHITRMQALAALDSDDLSDEHRVEHPGGTTSGSPFPRAYSRSDSVIDPEANTAEELARITEVKAKPDLQQILLKLEETSEEVSPPFGTISCEKQPLEVDRKCFPFREDVSALASKDMRRNTISGDDPSSFFKPDSVLALIVSRRYAQSGRLMSCITIPAVSNFPGKVFETSEKHFQSLDFDDEVFLRRMQREYYKTLLGHSCFSRIWRRWFSAKTLKHIAMVRPTSAVEELAEESQSSIARHNGVRGSRVLAEKSVDAAFSEEQLFQHFRNPKIGAARYAWVHWAHRIAASSLAEAGTAACNEADRERGRKRRRSDRPESSVCAPVQDIFASPTAVSLEFVEGWSPWRIITAAIIIILASIAAALLWIFLGPASPGNSWTVATIGNSQSWTDATHRVGGGLLMGGLIIIFGCIVLGSWLVVSWIWMS